MKLRDRFDELLEQTLDADASVRLAAAEGLVAAGKDALPALVGALNHKHNAIRQTAALTLGRMGDAARGAISALIALSHDADLPLRRLIVWALGRVGKRVPAAISALVAAAGDEDEDVRDFAAFALDAIGPATMSKLVEALQNAPEGSDVLLQAVTLSYETSAAGSDVGVVPRTPSLLEECFPEVHKKLMGSLHGGRIAKSMKSYLQAFSVVISTGSFYKAAPMLDLEGHKAISYRIRALESALGTRLAVAVDGAGRKKIEVTQEGKALAEWMALNPEMLG